MVDDDFVAQKTVRRALDKAGMTTLVHSAHCAAEALQALGTVRWDCILLDNRMPDRDGIDILSELVAADPATAIALVSDSVDEHLASSAIRLGAVEYVPKAELADRGIDRLVLGLAEMTRLRRAAHESERALARTTAHLRKAQRLARVAYWERDLRNNESTWSDSLYDLLGLSPREVRPCVEAFLASVPGVDQAIVRTSMDLALTSDRPVTFEHRMSGPDGRPIVVRHVVERELGTDRRPERLVSVVQDVTDSRIGHERLHDIMTSVADAVAGWDRDGRLVTWNEAWERRFSDGILQPHYGLRFEDFVRHRAEHGLACGVDGATDSLVADRLARFWNGNVAELSYRDGSWWRLTERPSADGGVIQVLSDITELKSREIALRASEQELHDLVDGSLQGIAVSDGAILFANQALADMFGYESPRELYTLGSVSDLAVPEDRGWMREYREIRKAGGDAPATYEFRGRRKDGRIIRVQRNVRIIQWRGRECYQSTYLDVTASRDAAARVADIAELVCQNPSPVLRIDADGAVLSCNPASAVVLRRWGIGEGGVVPDPWRSHLRRALADGAVGEVEEQFGEATFLFKFVPFAEAGHVNVYGTDISENRRTEQALHRAQRLEALGTLTGGIAHDFNNLLTVVIGSLDTLGDVLPPDSPGAGLCASALRASERGADLTRRLLAFARCQALRPSRVDVNKLLGELTEMLRRTIGGSVELSFRPGILPGTLLVDAALLESAILNLAVNARDAMPDGGRLVIETRAVLVHPEDVGAGFPTPGEYLVVTVSDTGQGIPKDALDRIFEPFFTTKENGSGSGLGLSMVFGFAKQSGGHVNVYSEPNVGTTVRLYLPFGVHAREASHPTKTDEDPVARARPGETVLVAEDDAAVRALVARQLEGLGYRVSLAANASEVEAKIGSGERPDLLFSDIVMPGGRFGHDLAGWVREHAPETAVLLTTGFAPDVVHVEIPDRPNIEILSKPYRRGDLAVKIRAALDARCTGSEG